MVLRAFDVMGTKANIVLVAGTERIADLIEESARQLDELWSRFRSTSDISRINNAEGATVTVDPLTSKLVIEMIAARTLTKGEYDPTILPRLLAEGYAASRKDPKLVTVLPASATWPVDPSGTVVTENTVTLTKGVTLDPGGIGKGVAADVLCALAISSGALGALIEIGGDLRIMGTPPSGKVWRIGIEDPWDDTKTLESVALIDGAVATSSTLKRAWEQNGKTVNHLISSQTGVSMNSDIVSVSVIANTAGIAEVLTKSGFTRPDYLDWVPALGAAALIIKNDGTIHKSKNWDDYS